MNRRSRIGVCACGLPTPSGAIFVPGTAALLVASGCERPRTTDAAADYNRDVRPILSNNCFRCHGPDDEAREAGLRLDIRDMTMTAFRA